MKTLKRIGLFFLLKVLEIIGVLLLFGVCGGIAIGIACLLAWLETQNEILPFILIGIFPLGLLIWVLPGIFRANWDYVKRKIK